MTSSLKLYTDEDVSARLARQLNIRGYDVLSCLQAGNSGQGLPDDWQLTFASEHGRVILTHNIPDYVALAHAWAFEGREHAGIILANRIPIAELIRRTARHLDHHSPDVHYNITRHLE